MPSTPRSPKTPRRSLRSDGPGSWNDSWIKHTDSPGPGMYNVASSFGTDAYKPTMRKLCSPGRTVASTVETPGPGRYDPKLNDNGMPRYTLRPRTSTPGGMSLFHIPESPPATKYHIDRNFQNAAPKPSCHAKIERRAWSATGPGPAKYNHFGTSRTCAPKTSAPGGFSMREKLLRAPTFDNRHNREPNDFPEPCRYNNIDKFGTQNQFAPLMIKPASARLDAEGRPAIVPMSPGPGPGKYMIHGLATTRSGS